MYRPPPGNYPPAPAVWREHTTPEGRKYWYNNITKNSTWEKPEELLTLEEKVLKGSSWREYTTPEGKKYYSNMKTKETVWEIPAEIKEQLERAKIVPMENTIKSTPPIRPPAETPVRVTTLSTHSTEAVPEFHTKEEAEKAFTRLLRETGVKSDWTWDQAMRAIITKPLYRALQSISERKACFYHYVDSEAKKEREEREEREARQKSNFMTMLENSKDIRSFTRYRTFVQLHGQQAAFTDIKSDQQREIYFEEYIQALQRREKDKLRELRKDSMERFHALLASIPEITYKTEWKEAQVLYRNTEEGKEPNAFEGMDMLDFLSVFEDYNRTLWEKPLHELNDKINQRRRKERRAREGFRNLLSELVSNGKINVRTLWKDIYPIIKDDSRYASAVGLPESTPLDMFWDTIDDLDEQLYQQKKIVYDALKRANFDVETDTHLEDYLRAIEEDERIKTGVNADNLRFIFEHLQAKAVYRLKEERRRQEKRLRKKMDIFRHALKHLQPPITLEDDWSTVRPRVAHLEEFQSIEVEEAREEAFNKYMKRLNEKKEEEEEEEEGMIKEEEEGIIREEEDPYDRRRSSSKRNRRREYSDDEDEKMRRKRKVC
ncbi:hypothetical protein BDB01DRAFT_802905 [Pilobolus umbonatus]|nr:hypothetical protein BDB01DRAFT_802905 [Pilobolus umbonatus]